MRVLPPPGDLWRSVAPRFEISACLIAAAFFVSALPVVAQESNRKSQSSADQAPISAPSTVSAGADNPLISALATAGAAEITDEQLKKSLQGKTVYLRDGFEDNSLSFDEHGRLTGHSARESFTLSLIQIEHVRLSKHKAEIEGVRYGLHFLGASADEDSTKAVDKVRVTPKKKVVKISIDREQVEKPKKPKDKSKSHKDKPKASPADSDSEQAAAPAEVVLKPGTTNSPAHAAQMLREAVDRVFAPGIDERMIAAMPAFWKLYFEAAAAKTDYRPQDSAILRQADVDRKAKLLSAIEPPSNQYAQADGVAGLALYHAVIGTDGQPGLIAAGRPIGFGLDENAVDAIRKAKFDPAIKDGKPVPVLVDLVVQFRIYSKRTQVMAATEAENSKPTAPILPGPYSIQAQAQ